jgi:hypothetical protein
MTDPELIDSVAKTLAETWESLAPLGGENPPESAWYDLARAVLEMRA